VENGKKSLLGQSTFIAEVITFWVMQFQDKDFHYYTGAPCVQTEIFILGLLFLGAFCH
jgi:hypothetical protein